VIRVSSTHEDIINAYTILVGKPAGKRLLVKPRCRREDNIKVGWEVWTGLIWLRTDGRLLLTRK
jgi:hypothetical protein